MARGGPPMARKNTVTVMSESVTWAASSTSGALVPLPHAVFIHISGL